MFDVKISFYGQGNVPRGIKAYDNIIVAEAHAYYVIDRYESGQIVGPAHDKRIKKVEVINRETGVTEIAWFYPADYDRSTYLHGAPLRENANV